MATHRYTLALTVVATAALLIACSTGEPAAPASTVPGGEATAVADTPSASGATTATESAPAAAAADPYDTDYGSNPPASPTNSAPADSTPTPAATTPAAGTAAAVHQTEIRSFRFEPLTVALGTTVSWTNADAPTPHTVTFEGGTPDSGSLGTAPFLHTFTVAGVFEYFCRIHPTMTGTVTVQ